MLSPHLQGIGEMKNKEQNQNSTQSQRMAFIVRPCCSDCEIIRAAGEVCRSGASR
jgi:hypothetical protein